MANVYTTNPMVLDTITVTTTDLISTSVTIKAIQYTNSSTSNIVVLTNSNNEIVARCLADGELRDYSHINLHTKGLRLHSSTQTTGTVQLLIYV